MGSNQHFVNRPTHPKHSSHAEDHPQDSRIFNRSKGPSNAPYTALPARACADLVVGVVLHAHAHPAAPPDLLEAGRLRTDAVQHAAELGARQDRRREDVRERSRSEANFDLRMETVRSHAYSSTRL